MGIPLTAKIMRRGTTPTNCGSSLLRSRVLFHIGNIPFAVDFLAAITVALAHQSGIFLRDNARSIDFLHEIQDFSDFLIY